MSNSIHIAALLQSYGINPTTPGSTIVPKYVGDGPDDEDAAKPWEHDDFIPVTKSGKQKSPNMIRNELQRYIDQCKADHTHTQKAIIENMGVNNNSFRRFMNPKTYKDQWSAVQNSTYWAAAKLLEKVKYEKEQAKKNSKKSSGKRKAADVAASGAGVGAGVGADDETAKRARTTVETSSVSASVTATVAPPKKTKATIKLEAASFVLEVCNTEGVPCDSPVYDTCPQLVKKIKTFLQRDGMTKRLLIDAFGGINSNSLNKFLSGKKQDQCGNVTYKESFRFFEKLRLLEKKPKSKARLKNEAEHPGGFSLVKERAGKYFLVRAFHGF